jgi:prophage DNA circulation protein
VDKLFQQAQEMKKGFTDALTQQKLTVDETYQAMVDAAKTAVEQMNQGDAAAAAMGETVSGLAQGISDHVSEVATAVDSIIAELDRLNGLGVSINLGSFGSINFPAFQP